MKPHLQVQKYLNMMKSHLNGAAGPLAGLDWLELYTSRGSSSVGARAARLRHEMYAYR